MPSQKFGAGNLFRNQRAVASLQINTQDENNRHQYAPDLTGDMEMTKGQLQALVELFKSGDTEVSQRSATKGEAIVKVSICGKKYQGNKAGDYLAVWLEEKWKPEKKKEEVKSDPDDDIPF